MRTPRLARKARLRWDKREARYMLLFPERGLLLNDSAAAILKLCDGAHTEEAIVEVIARDTEGADPERVRGDVGAFLDDMMRRGLVEAS